MTRALGTAAVLAFASMVSPAGLAEPAVDFSSEERTVILAQGPWPPTMPPDPSNKFSGDPGAIAFGRRLFFNRRLSSDGQRSCATCHDPAKAFADGKARSVGHAMLDRNAIALANLRLNRWFGWAGGADNLWAQSISPMLEERELGLSADLLRRRIAEDPALAAEYLQVFDRAASNEEPERVLVSIAKALAAYQETIVTGRTPFDEFRDALERNNQDAMARYPPAARRGLKIFVGKGNCAACHFGPNFTHGEFEDAGVPHFAEKGRVDQGRYGGIAALLASPFNMLGAYNDDPSKTSAVAPTRHVEQLHRNWGEFRVPSLRNVARTGPYMHDGSLITLADVVRHYAELNEERLHGHEGVRLLRALRLTPQEQADLVAFLETLTSEITSSR
jgi:cytochrome c peroxidase